MSEVEYCDKCGYIKQQCECEKTQTNADRIRSMTDMELAKFLCSWSCNTKGWCDECSSIKGTWCNGIRDYAGKEELEWLQSPAEV